MKKFDLRAKQVHFAAVKAQVCSLKTIKTKTLSSYVLLSLVTCSSNTLQNNHPKTCRSNIRKLILLFVALKSICEESLKHENKHLRLRT